MSAIITDQIRILNAKNFVAGVSTSTNSYYAFVGLPNPTSISSTWDSSPPAPIDSFNNMNDYYDSMLAVKRITSADVKQIVPKQNWNSGTTYDINTTDTIQSITGSGTIDIASNRTLTAGSDDGSESIQGNFTGAGNFTKVGAGTYTLQGSSNNLSGTYTVSAGELVVKGDLTNNPSLVNNGTFSMDGGNLTFSSVEGSGLFSLPDSLTMTTENNSTKTISGTFDGNGTLIKQGSGTLIL